MLTRLQRTNSRFFSFSIHELRNSETKEKQTFMLLYLVGLRNGIISNWQFSWYRGFQQTAANWAPAIAVISAQASNANCRIKVLPLTNYLSTNCSAIYRPITIQTNACVHKLQRMIDVPNRRIQNERAQQRTTTTLLTTTSTIIKIHSIYVNNKYFNNYNGIRGVRTRKSLINESAWPIGPLYTESWL